MEKFWYSIDCAPKNEWITVRDSLWFKYEAHFRNEKWITSDGKIINPIEWLGNQ